jgi:hypothetical protein
MFNKIIAFDLDDVLCSRASDVGGRVNKFSTSKPNESMIDVVNQCYDSGAKVIIYTARGMTSFKGNPHDIYDNLYELTKAQLNNWGIKYHKLAMGKLHYDVLIDDKAINSSNINKLEDIKKFLQIGEIND